MKTLLTFLRPYRALCVFTLLATALDVAGALYIPTVLADMINLGVEGGNLRLLLEKGALMLAAALLSGAGSLAGCFFCARLSARLGRDLRVALYEKSLTFSTGDFSAFGTGSMITRTLSDVNVVQQALVQTIQMVLPVPFMCIIGVVMAWSIDPLMGALLVGVTLAVVLGALVVTRRAASIFERVQALLDRINVVVRENLTGVRVIRAFHKEKREQARMGTVFSDYAGAAIQANTLFFLLESLAMFVVNVAVVAILWLGANRVGRGAFPIGDISALTEYAILILFYVMMAQMVFLLLPRAKVCLGRIAAVLAWKPEIADGENTFPTEPAGTRQGEELFRFEQASFRFPEADEAALQGLSFMLRRGETTAIIGSTGSGKTTVAQLLLRFHDVTEGRLLFRGEDVRSLSQEALRSRVAYVPQKAWLFSGTVGENLRHGNPQAGDEVLWHALDVAQANFVRDLPGGLQARVAQGGTNFSGGQKQRLAIARALTRKADLYLFDDSFSALDFRTDAALRRALTEEVKESAVLIIAQRVSTIAHADQILVLEDGRPVGLGRHETLLTTCPVYRDIVQSQEKGGGSYAG